MSLKKLNKDNKLSPRYYGPYKVLQKIGSMAYKLELPVSSQVRPIFHVSCLKKVIGDKIPSQTIFLKLDEEGKSILELEKISKTRTKRLQNRVITMYLIKLKNLPVEFRHEKMSPSHKIIHNSPHVEDNTCLKGRGMVSPKLWCITPKLWHVTLELLFY